MKRESSAILQGDKMTVYKFAGFWRRFVAYTIDNIIINIVFSILAVIITTAFVMGSMSGSSRAWIADIANPSRLTSVTFLFIIFYIFVSIVYFTYFHGIKGRTPGKMLLGLQVLSAEGNPIGFGTAFLRSVGYLVSSLLFTFPLGFIWAAFDRRKQGWHDKIAGTVVIIRPDENEAAGLTIPEAHTVNAAPPTEDRQNETGFPVEVQQSEPPKGENTVITGQPGGNDQKIP
jgi:uncharacterized RDD family membrane protein YckC